MNVNDGQKHGDGEPPNLNDQTHRFSLGKEPCRSHSSKSIGGAICSVLFQGGGEGVRHPICIQFMHLFMHSCTHSCTPTCSDSLFYVIWCPVCQELRQGLASLRQLSCHSSLREKPRFMSSAFEKIAGLGGWPFLAMWRVHTVITWLTSKLDGFKMIEEYRRRSFWGCFGGTFMGIPPGHAMAKCLKLCWPRAEPAQRQFHTNRGTWSAAV